MKKKVFHRTEPSASAAPPLPQKQCWGQAGGLAQTEKRIFSQRYEAPKTLHKQCYWGRRGAPGWRGGGCQEPLFSQTPVTCSTCCHIVTTPECVPLCTGQMSCWSSRMRQDLAQSSRTSHPSVESGSAFSCKVAGHRYLLGKLLPTPVAVWALVRSRGTKTLTGQTSSHSCCYLSSRAKSRDKDTCWVLLTPVAVLLGKVLLTCFLSSCAKSRDETLARTLDSSAMGRHLTPASQPASTFSRVEASVEHVW